MVNPMLTRDPRCGPPHALDIDMREALLVCCMCMWTRSRCPSPRVNPGVNLAVHLTRGVVMLLCLLGCITDADEMKIDETYIIIYIFSFSLLLPFTIFHFHPACPPNETLRRTVHDTKVNNLFLLLLLLLTHAYVFLPCPC